VFTLVRSLCTFIMVMFRIYGTLISGNSRATIIFTRESTHNTQECAPNYIF
jgi:hypothetical protein